MPSGSTCADDCNAVQLLDYRGQFLPLRRVWSGITEDDFRCFRLPCGAVNISGAPERLVNRFLWAKIRSLSPGDVVELLDYLKEHLELLNRDFYVPVHRSPVPTEHGDIVEAVFGGACGNVIAQQGTNSLNRRLRYLTMKPCQMPQADGRSTPG